MFGGLGGGSQPGSQVPVVESAPSAFYNETAAALAEAFVALMRLRAGWYNLGPPHQKLPAGSGALLVPFGDDMKFQNAEKQYGQRPTLPTLLLVQCDFACLASPAWLYLLGLTCLA